MPRSRLRFARTLLAAATLAAPGPALAGAWTQPTGAWYARVAAAGTDTGTRFGSDSGRVPFQSAGTIARDADYATRELRAYLEYGLTDRITGYGSLSHKQVAIEEATARRETWGTGDLWIGGRVRLTPADTPPVSLAAEAWLPTGYDAADQPALGTGQADAALRLLAGLSGRGWYATGDVGWMLRGGDFADQLLANLEAGGNVGRFGGRAVVRLTEAVGSEAAPTSAFDPALANPRLWQLDLTGGFAILPGLNLEAGVSHALAGREALAGNTFEIALARTGRAGRK